MVCYVGFTGNVFELKKVAYQVTGIFFKFSF